MPAQIAASEAHPAWRSAGHWLPRLWAWAAVLALAVNLRTTVASASPLVADIRLDLRASGAELGFLTALPVLCMAWLAPAAHRLVHRFGPERAVLVASAAVGVGNGLRLAGTHLPALLAATFVAGAGVAVAGVALPALVRALFPNYVGRATGAYTVAMMLGAAAASAASVPLRDLFGSWPRSLGAWGLPAAVATVLWLGGGRVVDRSRSGNLGRSPRSHPGRPPGPPGDVRSTGPRRPRRGLPWRSPAARTIAVFLSLQSMLAYAYLGWLPPLLQGQGVGDQAAGALLGAHNLAQLVAAVALPALADRVHDVRRLVLAAVSLTVVGAVWMAALPGLLPWVGVSVLGLGLGGGFSLGLVAATSYAADPAAASRVVAMVFTVCYTAAAAAPVLVGVLHDVTGGFRLPFSLLVLLAAGQWSVAFRLQPHWRGSIH